MPHHCTPIALYGPPGSGKSTLIAAARARGLVAVDLETTALGSPARARALAGLRHAPHPTLVGAADAPPEDFPAGTCFVLLAPAPAELERRVRARGDRRERKWVDHALQVRAEHLAMAAAGRFHLVVEAVATPGEVLDHILAESVAATTARGSRS